MANQDHYGGTLSDRVPLKALARVASVAAGVQFGWALQLSLLTPYVQELGIPHTFASYIWLCGPISGMFVQPIVGYYSDSCENKWGRRRPFILGGALAVVVSVVIISFAADFGYMLGDPLGKRPRAIVIFVVGFWLLDLANNTLQGPCRALLADFTGKDVRRNRRANAFFSLFMAIGNVLGFAAGAYNNWPKVFPFTRTNACDLPCANLKSAFILDVIILVITTTLSITAASEIPWSPRTKSQQYSTPTTPLLHDKLAANGSNELESAAAGTAAAADEEEEEDEQVSEAFFWELIVTLKHLPRQMWCILIVTALTWVAWFPFLLFDTDWMGREVFNGEPSSKSIQLSNLYDKGVRTGSFGLMLNAVVLGLTSVLIDPLCRRLRPSYVWGIANFIMCICFVGIVGITLIVKNSSHSYPSTGITAASLIIFAALGAPLAVTYSLPYALTSTCTNTAGGGQGLSMGVLNLAVVLPQVFVSLGSGPWDALLGGGNAPSFVIAAVASLVGGVLAIFILPRPPPQWKIGGIRRTRSSPIP